MNPFPYLPPPLPSGHWAVPSLPGASAALFLLSQHARAVIAVTESHPAAESLRLDLSAFGAPPSVRVVPLSELTAAIPDPAAVAAATLHPIPGATFATADLPERLITLGYERFPEVDASGQFALRGGILDVWPPDASSPLRLEFFGDTLETLHAFDPGTQRRTAETPVAPTIPPTVTADLPRIQLSDTLPADTLILWLEHTVLAEQTELLHLESRTVPKWFALLKRFAQPNQIFTGDPPPGNIPTAPFEAAPFAGLAESGIDAHHPELLQQQRHKLLAELDRQAASGHPVCIYADTMGTIELLTRELPPGSAVELVRKPLSAGCVLPGFTLVAQPDLYAIRKQSIRRPLLSNKLGSRVEQLAELSPGDFVVHIDHGIGRYIGTTELEIAGRRSEVITLEYAGGAKLHVPVSQVNLISRYIGIAGGKLKLHRLGSARWTHDKTDAERAVQDLAAALLETQARRNLLKGVTFDVAPEWFHEFEAAFPYQETDDQQRVIVEVKADMASSRPMDRLICGDAGYGKTEIAMRAAFIAVMNRRQVAVLVPTTVLAEQHYETFSERMAAYPVTLAVVSRFRTPAERRRILADAAEGKIDILIGTHALLQEGVTFANLGLLIVDEEQRFGVAHKERLKQLRGLVDVLTLSATPIPRTLYMSMTGARDMSLLQTPPKERQPVETKVVRDSDAPVRGAILHELNRGGQVYFLYNRVLTLPMIHRRLAQLVPEASFGIAHGQMPAHELETAMQDFETGRTNVLLCTTLVENGLDIPRANTILIHRADRFGIADLYQLRGRVGRAAVKAYAYLLLPENGHVDADARERIKALQKHSGLGSGFNLALRDLEIRGAGNLLGSAQSGYIAAVGLGLYCQLLRRTVTRLKGEPPPLLVDVALSLDFLDLSPGLFDDDTSACLPYNYIDEDVHRLGIHRRLAEASAPSEVAALADELADRYGKLPEAVRKLLDLTQIRILAAERQICRIEVKEKTINLFDARTRAALTIRGIRPHLSGKTSAQKLKSLRAAILAVPAKNIELR